MARDFCADQDVFSQEYRLHIYVLEEYLRQPAKIPQDFLALDCLIWYALTKRRGKYVPNCKNSLR